MPSVKAKAAKLQTADGVVTLDLVRKVYDYERDTVTVVFAVLVKGLEGRTEKAITYSIAEAAKKVAKQDEAANAWFFADAQARGLIPAGTLV